MTEQANIPANEVSFKDFLFKDKRNRTILCLAAIATVIQFTVFKYFYPFASFIHDDSYEYLKTAFYNLDINTYLVGYSRFLRFFSVFTSSDLIFVGFQYLLIQASALFLLFTIFYLQTPIKAIQILLVCFMIFNPLFLHLANLISSDGFFLALSLIWFTLLLWIIYLPSNLIILSHSIVLFIAFTVRYNALIYPFIAIFAYCLAPLPIKKKIIGITAGTLFCAFFVCYTSYKFQKLTGHWQYSPFSGWQWANNAMYTYKYVDITKRKPVPNKFQEIDKMIREYFDSTRDIKKYPTEAAMASTFYMWSNGMPLMRYRDSVFKKDTAASELKRWATMGPFYKAYGIHIIKQYPWHFVRYFLWPNANKYYAPPVEFLNKYNSGKDSVWQLAQVWFNYKNGKLNTRTKDQNVSILNFYPIFSGVINVIMVCSLVCYFLLAGAKLNGPIKKGILLGSSLWLLNAVFTIGASSAALRFQTFPIIITTIFATLLIDWMIQLLTFLKEENKKSFIREQKLNKTLA